MFRVGLVLLKSMLGSQEKLKSCQGLYETMELLRAIKPQYMQEKFLIREVSDPPHGLGQFFKCVSTFFITFFFFG